MKHISILGAGSIGCWVGGHLFAGGSRVTLIGRERFAKEIESHGLKLSHFERPDISLNDVPYVTDDNSLGDADIIVLCTKSQDTEKAAEQIRRKAKANARIVSFQNGIRNFETLESYLPKTMEVIPGIVPFNVTPTGQGGFHCGTAGVPAVPQ